MLKNKKILILAPHPDDEAICSGGLIILAKKMKAEVFVLFMAIGTSRQFITGKTGSKVRLSEIRQASTFGNYSYSIAFRGKPFMRLDTIEQKKIIEIIEDTTEKVKPDIVIIPFRESFDQDHRAVAMACITSLRPLPKQTRHQPTMILESEEPYLWGVKNTFSPNYFFDISDVLDEKIKLLECHTTQLRHDPFPRSPENLRRLAGMRGCEISSKYAEAYHLLKGQPFT